MKEKIENWIETVFANKVDGFGDFMASLQKEYPELHEKVLNVIWEFAMVESVEDEIAQAELVEEFVLR